MLDQLLAGGATSLVNLVIHALIMGALVHLVLGMAGRGPGAPEFLRYTVVIVTTGGVLYAAHFAEVLLWAYTYAAVGAAPPGTDLVYFAFSNYTTLGYGRHPAGRPLAASCSDDGAERHHADRLVHGADLRILAPYGAAIGEALRQSS